MLNFLLCFSLLSVNAQKEKFRPIYKFDTDAEQYCFPDYAKIENDFVCKTTLNQNAPVYVRKDICGCYTVYTYFLWYGLQKSCFEGIPLGHGNDWEEISVFTRDGEVKKVVYHQHSGFYTRVRGTFELEGERPVVYVGQIAHGSYHAGCVNCAGDQIEDYKCTGALEECPGPLICGYWDDLRRPGPELRDVQVVPLQPGQTIDGIERPDRQVCDLPPCRGIDDRVVYTLPEVQKLYNNVLYFLTQLNKITATYGCWQNNG
eukprot:TRINITY_DN3332_c0_g1_i10.p2 TRINITY_DN3332_c0_g1~~TRINITY_DN3332_c0_g1_i10.p2  ORF type:complete len:271 (-),score=10.18 TRINITY_DN3332_c0_g1_i10:593-1372(-)